MNTKIRIDSKTKMLIISVVAFLTALIGVSFAWLRSDLASNSSSLFVGSAGLTMMFHGTGGVINVDLAPGEKMEEIFEVENISNVPQAYNILWRDVTNTFVDKNYFMYTLENIDTGELLFLPKYLPSNSSHVAYNITIPANTTQTYKLTIYYIDDPKYNQLQNANTSFTALLSMGGVTPDKDSHEVLSIFVDGVYSEYLPTLSNYTIDATRTFCTDGSSISIVNNDIEIANQTDTTTCDLYLVSSSPAPITNDPYNLMVIDLKGGNLKSVPENGYRYSGDIIELGTPEKLGYAFIGWEVSGNGAAITENTKVTMGTTYTYVKAKWVKGHWNKVVQTCTQGAPATYTRSYKVCEQNIDNYTKVEKTCAPTSYSETKSLCGISGITQTTYTCDRVANANCSWSSSGYTYSDSCSVTSPSCTNGATKITGCTRVYSGSCTCMESYKTNANCDYYCSGSCSGQYCTHKEFVSHSLALSCSNNCLHMGYNAGGSGSLLSEYQAATSTCSCTYTYSYKYPSSGTTTTVSPSQCSEHADSCSTVSHYNSGNTKVTCGDPKTYGWVSSSTRTVASCGSTGSCNSSTSGNTYVTSCTPTAYNFSSPTDPTTVASCTPSNIACDSTTNGSVHRTCTPNYSYSLGTQTQETVDSCSVSTFECTENTVGSEYTTSCTPNTYNYGYEASTVQSGACYASASHNTCTSGNVGETYISGCELIEDDSADISYTFEYTGETYESMPIVRAIDNPTEEFYDITNAVNYSSMDATFKTKINYAASKSILLARYNLSKATGLQTTSTIRSDYAVPFCGSTSNSNGYWDPDGSGINSDYGTYTNYENNIYDTYYITAPNYSVAFSNNAGNANYSIAYYVEEYIETLGIEGTGRLLTYPEANTMTKAQRTNGQWYWLGSATYSRNVRYVYHNGNFSSDSFYTASYDGVRPVIIIDTSEIQPAS